MSAFVARLRIVRDLVALVAVALRHLAGQRVDGGLGILRRKCQRAGLLHCPKRGAVLDDEVIDRDMLRLQHEHMAEGLAPGLLGLAGNLVDEVDVDVSEALHPCALIALQEVLEEVKTTEGTELIVVCRLEADGEAVDAGVAVGRKLIGDGRGRVALDGDLGVRANGIEAADVVHDAGDVLRIQQRRGTATDEDRRDLVVRRQRGAFPDLCTELIDVGAVLRFFHRKGEEVTVIALPCAEWDVDVQLELLMVV